VLGVVLALCLIADASHRHERRDRRDMRDRRDRRERRERRNHRHHNGQLEYHDQFAEEVAKETREEKTEVMESSPDNGNAPDPCKDLQCNDGEHCVVDNEARASCVCMDTCAIYNDPRSAICSANNVTFESECEFYRQVCLCKSGAKDCKDMNIVDEHDHLDYYGQCQDIKPCSTEELKNFPSRMAKWLTNVMETLDKRQELEIKFSDMHRRSRRSKNPEIVPILWEFCQMDSSKDRIVSRSEFFPLIAPLKPLEHCIGDFLDRCDQNSNGEITLQEWGHCLNIPDDNIEDICEGVDGHHVRLQG